MTDLLSDLPEQDECIVFTPTRSAGLRRLEQFVARSGRHYARTRNYDHGPARRSNVSALSPWLRHRLITEEEVLTRVLAVHAGNDADKFIQEVFWRTYFKGWLEQRPSVWATYQHSLMDCFDRLDSAPALHADYSDAVSGKTGIDCFDHWAAELVDTGYLHNHARMWMASIWIFTLRLPWELGADFFMRHLIDGDPASNTLSWRWVAGLHTKGKTYLARPDNIAKYTSGRFQPKGLAQVAEPLMESFDHAHVEIPVFHEAPQSRCVLLFTEDDMRATDVLAPTAGAIGLLATHGRSPRQMDTIATTFAENAMRSMLAPIGGDVRSADDWSAPLIDAAQCAGVNDIVVLQPPIGPARTRLDRAEPVLRAAGISLCRVIRPYDRLSWPHAKAGFFGMKKKIPSILQDLSLRSTATALL